MKFCTLPELPISDYSRILLRADLDVKTDTKGVFSEHRMRALLPTVRYITDRKARVIMIAHMDRPKAYDVSLSLHPLVQRLEELLGLNVEFADPWRNEEADEAIKSGRFQIVLLENLRFHRGETDNDVKFAQELAQYGDYFVNDAFGNSHRAHASIMRLPFLLPSAAGLRLQEEVDVLSRVFENPKRPLVVVIGGVKVETKLRMVERFLDVADDLLLGGGLANIFLHIRGVEVGNSPMEEDSVIYAKRLDSFNKKLHLPLDVVATSDVTGSGDACIRRIGDIHPDEYIYDIGPDTRKMFAEIIKAAGTIIWNGVMGYMSSPFFHKGTEEIAEAVADSTAYTIVGGGSVSAALNDLGLSDRIDHISTGGGAMLAFLAGDELPGLKSLVASKDKFKL